jgi:hypothetical protein
MDQLEIKGSTQLCRPELGRSVRMERDEPLVSGCKEVTPSRIYIHGSAYGLHSLTLKLNSVLDAINIPEALSLGNRGNAQLKQC